MENCMRPITGPAVVSQTLQSQDNPKLKLIVSAEHEDGTLLAEAELGKWVLRLIGYADGEDLLREIMLWSESGQVTPPPDLAKRIRAHFQKIAAE